MSNSTMNAAVCRTFGGPEVVHIETVPKPSAGPNQVLVRVHASSVTIADYRCRTRDLPKGLGALGMVMLGVFTPSKKVLGADFTGIVESVGERVTTFSPGDRVIATTGLRMGGHAEYIVMDEDAAIAIAPANLSLEDAAALPFGGITMRLFYNHVQWKPGMRVLVNGASGSTGTAAVQLAKANGAHVTGVSRAVNHDLLRSLGADEVIDYEKVDFASTALEGTVQTYDVVVDCVGNAPFERVGSIVRPGGALLLVVGDLRSMLTTRRDSRRSGKVVTTATPAATASDMKYLVELAEAGQLVPVIDRRYSLSEIVEAHRYVGTHRKRGNLVLELV